MTFEGFVTPYLPSPTEANYSINKLKNSLHIEHNNGISVDVYMKPENPTIYFDMSNSQKNTEIGMGEIKDAIVDRLYINFGTVIENKNRELRGSINHKGWEQLDSKMVGVELDNGISMIQSEGFMPNRLEVGNNKVSLRSVLKKPSIRFIFTKKSIGHAALKYKEEVFANNERIHDPEYLKQTAKLRGRTWLGMWREIPYDNHTKALSKIFKFGLHSDIAVLIHKWQHFGYDVKYPVMYPANPELGGNEAT